MRHLKKWLKFYDNLTALLDAIIEHIPAPKQLEGTPQMLITSLDYSSYTGRIAVAIEGFTIIENKDLQTSKR